MVESTWIWSEQIKETPLKLKIHSLFFKMLVKLKKQEQGNHILKQFNSSLHNSSSKIAGKFHLPPFKEVKE